MLSSTSLLHGNCIFNRNNTVATQQGMKTYWLCKSYRITMCRARCITHQGRVISATGMHNHPPHMKGSYPNPNCEFTPQSGNGPLPLNNNSSLSISMRLPPLQQATTSTSGLTSSSTTNLSQTPSPHHNMLASSTQHSTESPTEPQQPPNTQLHNDTPSDTQPDDTHSTQHETSDNVTHHSPSTLNHHHHLHHQPVLSPNNNNTISLQNMMQSVLSQNNLMHLSNITPILNPMQHHSHLTELNNAHPSLHILGADSAGSSHHLHSPNSPRNANALHHQQNIHNHSQHNHGQHHSTHHSHQTDPIQQHNHYHHHHPRESQQSDDNSSVVATADNA